MNAVVCPYCSHSTADAGEEAVAACPRCGQRWRAPGAVPVADTDSADGALIADLRDAFGFSTEALRPIGGLRAGDRTVESSRILDVGSWPPGSRLGDFEIMAELGRGGMGVVYRARQISLGREVALKVLPAFARYGRYAVQRFQAEAQAAGRLHHTNVVSVYAQSQEQGHYYYAMELVDGVGLDVVIRSRPDLLSSLPRTGDSSSVFAALRSEAAQPSVAAEVVAPSAGALTRVRWSRADYRHMARLMADVADALECAHRSGIIHRDVKPHNLLLSTQNRLHLTDFGLARLTAEPHLTVSGEVLGTPAYLSPEQVRGRPGEIDHRTDLYSLGVTLYEILTQRKPFEGETREQIMSQIGVVEPISPRRLNPQIPLDLETVCLRAMDKDPGRRHPTAGLLAEDLRRFADGRPILSRRTSRIEKAVKWVRRRKALTAAIAAVALVVVLGGALAWSWRGDRERQARERLAKTYVQLAYFDYRTPGCEAEIDAAAAGGADAGEVEVARALVSLGGGAWREAHKHLEAVLHERPRDRRARYLLAWAQREAEQNAAARTTLEAAEQEGLPVHPDEWFFRGLALHWDDPEAAIEAYRQASVVRAQEHGFYPQAVLHLARARNQQLYRTRRLEPFAEAADNLELLAKNGYYGAYPHYLLSITHRFAAEIYTGSGGTRDDSAVRDHYAAALDWARRGEVVDPASERPITAEAECLESMGSYDEAIAARTRALVLADTDGKRHEACHYRWRLHYWTGDLESAGADLETLAGLEPNNPYYRHFYPALVLAERGLLPEALAHARALADEAPTSALAVLSSATCLRLLGQADEADQLLDGLAPAVDFGAGLAPPQTPEWIRALYTMCRDGADPATLLALSSEQTRSPWKLWGEAYFHAAAQRLAAGDRDAARDYLRTAYRSFDSETRYTYHAKLLYVRMEMDLGWPLWIPAPTEAVRSQPPFFLAPDGRQPESEADRLFPRGVLRVAREAGSGQKKVVPSPGELISYEYGLAVLRGDASGGAAEPAVGRGGESR